MKEDLSPLFPFFPLMSESDGFREGRAGLSKGVRFHISLDEHVIPVDDGSAAFFSRERGRLRGIVPDDPETEAGADGTAYLNDIAGVEISRDSRDTDRQQADRTFFRKKDILRAVIYDDGSHREPVRMSETPFYAARFLGRNNGRSDGLSREYVTNDIRFPTVRDMDGDSRGSEPFGDRKFRKHAAASDSGLVGGNMLPNIREVCGLYPSDRF